MILNFKMFTQFSVFSRICIHRKLFISFKFYSTFSKILLFGVFSGYLSLAKLFFIKNLGFFIKNLLILRGLLFFFHSLVKSTKD